MPDSSPPDNPADPAASPAKPGLLERLWTVRTRTAAAQALRVMIGCAVTYALFRLIGLKQGQWAIFTVLIVMQGSVGATAGAAVDRLVATVAGALLGGAVLLAIPHQPLAMGIGLVFAVGVTAFAAVRQPRLRGGGVTVAIVLLTHSPEIPVGTFVLERILEITLGGVIGVLASRLVLPSQSGNVMVERFRQVMQVMADMLDQQANALETGKVAFSVDASIALRKSLVAAEALLVDARRERTMLLARHEVSEAIPRTLWRIRNGVVHIGRLLDTPLPCGLVTLVGAPATAMMREQSQAVHACMQALGKGRAPQIHHASADAFEADFAKLEHAHVIRDIPFEDMGRLFGLAFALRKMRQDIDDLAERITEGQGG
ncbi:MAG: FUSC family protein [Sphingomonadales bacterium]|nr:FUSC family protein [Sphingomonadales bacterium]MDE2168184.1 FUSC family protein [Sphingomonadales bacterium]